VSNFPFSCSKASRKVICFFSIQTLLSDKEGDWQQVLQRQSGVIPKERTTELFWIKVRIQLQNFNLQLQKSFKVLVDYITCIWGVQQGCGSTFTAGVAMMILKKIFGLYLILWSTSDNKNNQKLISLASRGFCPESYLTDSTFSGSGTDVIKMDRPLLVQESFVKGAICGMRELPECTGCAV
ncbi:hypothetical protein L9F63_012220, partial [Diploptera punctata]